jgi:hypothetical protein
VVRLDDLIGKQIILAMRDSEKGVYKAVLHGTENGGIWIESPEMTKRVGKIWKHPRRSLPQPTRKPVFFIPYSQLAFLIAPSVELDGRAIHG